MTEHDVRAGARSADAAAIVLAALVGALLQFSAFAKIITANKLKYVPILPAEWKFVEAWTIGAMEMVIVLLVLLARRWRGTWLVTAVFFAGLGGFALHAFVHDIDCGCFGKLIELPRGFSLGMDILFAAASLGLAAWMGVRWGGLIGAGAAGVVAAGLGFAYAEAGVKDKPARPDDAPIPMIETVEPPPSADGLSTPALDHAHKDGVSDAAIKFVDELPMAEPLRAGDPYQTWYVFLYDPDCEVCEEIKPDVEIARDEAAAQPQPTLKILMQSIPELGEQHDLPFWAWNATPTILIVRGGAILDEIYGEEVLDRGWPILISQAVESGQL